MVTSIRMFGGMISRTKGPAGGTETKNHQSSVGMVKETTFQDIKNKRDAHSQENRNSIGNDDERENQAFEREEGDEKKSIIGRNAKLVRLKHRLKKASPRLLREKVTSPNRHARTRPLKKERESGLLMTKRLINLLVKYGSRPWTQTPEGDTIIIFLPAKRHGESPIIFRNLKTVLIAPRRRIKNRSNCLKNQRN